MKVFKVTLAEYRNGVVGEDCFLCGYIFANTICEARDNLSSIELPINPNSILVLKELKNGFIEIGKSL
ncbi:MAG: hypothetical protein LBQ27_00460 [Clostridiales bacterium]|jgi:hypothetical protein|nr:hypothetical protein [Clostridiales bacterium]